MSNNYSVSYHDPDHYVMTFESFNAGIVKSKVCNTIFCFLFTRVTKNSSQPPTVKEMFARALMQIAGMSVDNVLALTEVYPTPAK